MNGVNSSVEGKSLVPHQKKCLEACKYLWARLSNHRNSMGIRKYLSGVGFSSNSWWRSTVSLSVWTQGPACGPAVASDILSGFLSELNCLRFASDCFRHHNRIRSIEASQLKPYVTLETLDLSFNDITEIRNGCFPQGLHIKELWVFLVGNSFCWVTTAEERASNLL